MTPTTPGPATRRPPNWAITATTGAACAVVAAVITTTGSAAISILEWLLITALATIGVPLAMYDFRERRLPNRLVWPLYATTGVLVVACGILTGDLARLGYAVLVGASLWAIYFLLGLLGAVAYGDIKLAGALALALGWWGIIPTLLGAAAAYVFALPHAIVHATTKSGRQIPFGPYMITGTITVAIWTHLQT
jgi:leader peptidase (prepilin peptidase)/N-methyltransferase